MKKSFGVALLAATVAVGAIGAAAAQDAKALYDARVAGMKQMGAAAGQLTRYVRGEAEYGPAVVQAAQSLDAAAKQLSGWFAVSTPVEGSRAKPEIWTNKADFDAKVAEAQTAAANLVRVAGSGDKAQITAAFQAVGASCGSCHRPYQAPR